MEITPETLPGMGSKIALTLMSLDTVPPCQSNVQSTPLMALRTSTSPTSA